MPRLNQVTKELNIGYHTAADFLIRRFGMVVGPNDKIPEEQYAALAEEFHRDKVLHSVAMKIAPPRRTRNNHGQKPKNVTFSETELEVILEENKENSESNSHKSPTKLHKRKKRAIAKKRVEESRKGGLFPYMGKFAKVVRVPFGGMNKK